MPSAPEPLRRGFFRGRWSRRGTSRKEPTVDAPVSAISNLSPAGPTVDTKAAQNMMDFFKDCSQSLRDLVAGSGAKLLAPPSVGPSTTTSPSDHPDRLTSRDSFPETIEFPLRDFQTLICCDKMIENADILSTELYSKWAGSVRHQFVVLELRQDGKPPLWLKLERTLAYPRHAATHFGFAPAYDKAIVGGERKALIRNAKRENRQEFHHLPKLAKLSLVLEGIWVESVRYILWSENCYFFSSAIQQRLGAEHGGKFVDGHLRYTFLAPSTRRQIEQEIRFMYRMRYGHPLAELLYAVTATMGAQEAKRIMDIPQRLEEDADSSHLVSRTILVCQLCEAVFGFGLTFSETERADDALVLLEATNDFLLRLSDWSERQFQEVVDWRRRYYEYFLWMFARLLRECIHLDRSCAIAARDVAIARWLFAVNTEQWRHSLASSLCDYGISLREAGRFSEACDAAAEDLSLSRLLYSSDSGAHLPDLQTSLHQYGISLREVGRFSEACDAGAEDVCLSRLLYASDPEYHHQNLMASLTQYGISLRSAQQFDEACVAGAEDVSGMRILFARNNDQSWNLADSLYHYGISLRAAGRYDEACDSSEEAVSLMRQLAAEDLKKHDKRFVETLDAYCEALSASGRGEQAVEILAEKEAIQSRSARM